MMRSIAVCVDLACRQGSLHPSQGEPFPQMAQPSLTRPLKAQQARRETASGLAALKLQEPQRLSQQTGNGAQAQTTASRQEQTGAVWAARQVQILVLEMLAPLEQDNA